MAPKKEGGLARRKGSVGRGERSVEEDAGQNRGITVVDIDPWGAFFENFWQQPAEGGSADRHGSERKAHKGTRPAGTKPGR